MLQRIAAKVEAENNVWQVFFVCVRLVQKAFVHAFTDFMVFTVLLIAHGRFHLTDKSPLTLIAY